MYRTTTAEHVLTLAILSAYPVLLLIMRGSMSALFFAMVALSLVMLLRTRAWRDPSNRDATTVAFTLAMASTVVVILPAQMYHHDLHWRPYDEAVRLLLAVPVYLAIRAGSTPVAQVLGLSLPVGAMLAMAVIGGDTTSATEVRLGANFLNVIHFGNLALMLGFLSLFSIQPMQDRSPVSITLKLCGLLAGIYLSLRSGTRGGWLVVPVLLVIWAALAVRLPPRTRYLVVLGLMGVVGLAVFFVYDVIHLRAIELQTDLAAFGRGDRDTSIGIRVQLMQVVMHILQENPLFGAGPQGYKATLNAMAQSGAITAEAVRLGNAEVHNQILSYAVKYGLPGLISGLAIHFVPLVIFARALRGAVGAARTAALMGICLVTGFFVFGLTVEILNLKHTVAFYSMTLAVLLGAAMRHERQSPPQA